MKRTYCSGLFFSIVVLGGIVPCAFGEVQFGSKHSTLKVSNNAKLFVSSEGFSVDGTLEQGSGATVSGNDITFNEGILAHSGAQALLTGKYSPSQTKIQMVGSSVFRFEPGSVVPAVTVASHGNRLEGQPIFSQPIAFSSGASLTMAIQSALNQNVTLNSGVLTLDCDLALADDVRLIGPGYIDLNYRQLTLGGYYSESWNTALTFGHATALFLSGHTTLGASANWTFAHTSRINGNGEILDITAGGKITIGAGQKLFIEDITINGLADGTFVFGSANSELHLTNATIILSENVNFASGKLFIDGETTFVLNGFNFTFSGAGIVTINGAVLWLEPLEKTTGFFQATIDGSTVAVYDEYGYNAQNVTAMQNAGLLVINGNGIIKKTFAQSNLDPEEQELLSGNLSRNVSLSRNLSIPPSRSIVANSSSTVNGNSTTLSLARGHQIFIAQDKTLTFRNITLTNITNDTFVFGQNAHLNIGENVIFQLAEDVEFTANTGGTNVAPLIRILDGVDGANTFAVQSINGKYSLTFSYATETSTNTQRPLRPGDNIISLENVELKGFDRSTLTPGVSDDALVEYPQVNLLGNASIDIHGRKVRESSLTERPKTSLDIFVEGENNALNIMRDSIIFGGTIVYGDLTVNTLHIRFAAQNLKLNRLGVNPANAILNGYPLLTLAGTGIGVYTPLIANSDPVTAMGKARLIFDDDNAAIEVFEPGALQVDTGAEILFNNFQLVGDSLIQNSMNVIIGGIGSNFIGSVDTTGVRGIHKKKERISLKQRRKKHTAQFARLSKFQSKLQEQHGTKDLLETIWEEPEALVTKRAEAVKPGIALHLPEVYDRPTIVDAYEELALPFNGKLTYNKSIIRNFVTFANDGTHDVDYQAFNLVLDSNNRVELQDVDMKLFKLDGLRSGSQLINVKGKGNEIIVKRTFTVKSNLFIGPDAELTFVFDQSSNDKNAIPTIVFDQSSLLELESNAIIRFKGNGRVILSDGVLFFCKGIADNSKKRLESATSKPKIIFTQGAVLDCAAFAHTIFAGVGALEITDRASIKPSAPCDITIGNPQIYTRPQNKESDPTYTSRNSASYYSMDDFDLVLNGYGEIRLDLPILPPLPQDQVIIDQCIRFGIQHCKCSINCEQNGVISVGTNAFFDINVNSKFAFDRSIPFEEFDESFTDETRSILSRLRSGRVTSISFAHDGKLFIYDGGMLTIGENLLSPITDETGLDLGAQVLRKNQEIPVSWFGNFANFAGKNGIVRHVASRVSRDVVGTFDPSKEILTTNNASILLKKIVENMIAK